VPEAVSAALLATPDDGQIVITGSLYVVGAARSFLVK
jgi:folylpolyglutamate synthase/dihydropteroate synthase